MSPSKLKQHVITARADWLRRMLEDIRSLPLDSFEVFVSDKKNIAAAESYLRRALESLFDLSRHILAKGFGIGVTEYKQTSAELEKNGVVPRDTAALLLLMAGYRNRMVHYYNEITDRELYELCSQRLPDIETVLNGLLEWVKNNPDKTDPAI